MKRSGTEPSGHHYIARRLRDRYYKACAFRRRKILSAGGGDEVAEAGGEVRSGEKILEGGVHAPAPVMTRIGGDINTLISGITRITDRTIN